MTHAPDIDVVYVDDSKANRVVFEHTTRDLFNVRCVASPLEALEILEHQEVAVLVSDQRMPEMSGNELLERVRDTHPDVIRMVITAYGDLDPILFAVNRGLVARYVVKPWNPEELVEMLGWGVETWRISRVDSAVYSRLMETERLVQLGSMAAAVLHDAKQPLTFIHTNVERLSMLAQDLESIDGHIDRDKLPPDVREGYEALLEDMPEIVDDLYSGCGIVLDILDGVNAILRGARDDEPDENPATTIRTAMRVCSHLVRYSSGAKLRYDGPEHLPTVNIPKNDLLQVLVNLISNAANAVKESGRVNRAVVISADPEGDELRIRVTDNGTGIPEPVLARLGTPFFTTRTTGTGLGINQVKRILARAAGEVQFESSLGEGTSVTAIVPLHRPAQTAS